MCSCSILKKKKINSTLLNIHRSNGDLLKSRTKTQSNRVHNEWEKPEKYQWYSKHKTLRQWCLVWLFLQLFVWYTFTLLNDQWARKQKQTSCVPPGDNVGKADCRLWVEGLLCSAYVTSPQPCDHFRCNKLPARKGIFFFQCFHWKV